MTASRYNESMNVETRPYLDRSAHYLAQASEELARGDSLQASEKGWGAAAQIVKAVAEERGWDHFRHVFLYENVRRVIQETNDTEYRNLFAYAGELHTNFYEGTLDLNDVTNHLGYVTRFVEKMRGLLDGN